MLLDEYDHPITLCFREENLKRFIIDFLKKSLKDNDFLGKALITGISKVAQESLFSDLNNVSSYHTVLDDSLYVLDFGFTEEDICGLLKDKFNIEDIERIKQYYGGYHVGAEGYRKAIFSPWTIANYLNNHCQFISYWVGTSAAKLIHDIILENKARWSPESEKSVQFETMKDTMAQLCRGEIVHLRLVEHLNFNLIFQEISAFWTLLYSTGYLSVLEKIVILNDFDQEVIHYKTCLPNTEIKDFFNSKYDEWFGDLESKALAEIGSFLSIEASNEVVEIVFSRLNKIKQIDKKIKNYLFDLLNNEDGNIRETSYQLLQKFDEDNEKLIKKNLLKLLSSSIKNIRQFSWEKLNALSFIDDLNSHNLSEIYNTLLKNIDGKYHHDIIEDSLVYLSELNRLTDQNVIDALVKLVDTSDKASKNEINYYFSFLLKVYKEIEDENFFSFVHGLIYKWLLNKNTDFIDTLFSRLSDFNHLSEKNFNEECIRLIKDIATEESTKRSIIDHMFDSEYIKIYLQNDKNYLMFFEILKSKIQSTNVESDIILGLIQLNPTAFDETLNLLTDENTLSLGAARSLRIQINDVADQLNQVQINKIVNYYLKINKKSFYKKIKTLSEIRQLVIKYSEKEGMIDYIIDQTLEIQDNNEKKEVLYFIRITKLLYFNSKARNFVIENFPDIYSNSDLNQARQDFESFEESEKFAITSSIQDKMHEKEEEEQFNIVALNCALCNDKSSHSFYGNICVFLDFMAYEKTRKFVFNILREESNHRNKLIKHYEQYINQNIDKDIDKKEEIFIECIDNLFTLNFPLANLLELIENLFLKNKNIFEKLIQLLRKNEETFMHSKEIMELIIKYFNSSDDLFIKRSGLKLLIEWLSPIKANFINYINTFKECLSSPDNLLRESAINYIINEKFLHDTLELREYIIQLVSNQYSIEVRKSALIALKSYKGFRKMATAVDMLKDASNDSAVRDIALEVINDLDIKSISIPIAPTSIHVSSISSSSSAPSSSSSSSSEETQILIDHVKKLHVDKVFLNREHKYLHTAPILVITEEAIQLRTQIQEQPHTVYQAWGRIPKDNTDFRGRENILRGLVERFIRRDSPQGQLEPATVFYQAAVGLGGIGKTQLAARYVRLCHAQQEAVAQSGTPATFEDTFNHITLEERPRMPLPYNAIIWLDASDEKALLASFHELAASIGLIFDEESIGNLSLVRQVIYKKLSLLPRILFVFDDVTEDTNIQAHLPESTAITWQGICDCLLTTRNRPLAKRYHAIEVGVFSPSESLAYLKGALSSEQLDAPQDDLERLADTLGHLPLALAQAVAYLKAQGGRVTVQVYLELYASNQPELLAILPDGDDKHLETVLTTWLLSMASLSASKWGARAVQLLLTTSFLAGSRIEYDLLKVYTQASDVELEILLTDLTRYSFVEPLEKESSLRVHGLVQDVMQLWLTGKLQAHLNDTQLLSLSGTEPVSSFTDILNNNLIRHQVPDTWIDIASMLCERLLAYAEPQEAPTMAELAKRKRLLPHLDAFISRLKHPALIIPESLSQEANNPSSLALLDRLAMDLYREQGMIAMEQGYFQIAKQSFQSCLHLEQVQYGEKHVQIASTLSNLGITLGALGDYPAKKALLERALAIQQAYYGEDHVLVASTLNNLGTALGTLGDHQAERALLARALAIQEACYGKDHFLVASTLNNLGNVLGALGDYPAKKALLERALAIQQAYYGEEHVLLANTFNNLGTVLNASGNPHAAQECLERALRIEEAHYGKGHVAVAGTLSNLGTVLGALGNYPAKKALLERALGIMEAYYGRHHVALVGTLFNLGMAKKALQQFQEAMQDLLRAFMLMQSTPGYEHHPHFLITNHQLTILISEHAEDYKSVSLAALLTEADSPAKQNDAAFQGYVGHRCLADNQLALALVYYQRAIQLSPTTTYVYHNAACCYHVTGAIKQAQACFEQGIAYHPTSSIHIEYAHFLYLQQQYAQALEHIQASRLLPVGGLSYGASQKSVIAQLLQTLLSKDDKRIELPSDGFGYYLAYECYLGLGQIDAAQEALNQLRQYCDNTGHETLTELYVLILSLPQRFLRAVNAEQSSQDTSSSTSLSSSSNAFFSRGP